LMPVVSKSKIQSGLWSFRFILELRVTGCGLQGGVVSFTS
jgi:hypothetical protein